MSDAPRSPGLGPHAARSAAPAVCVLCVLEGDAPTGERARAALLRLAQSVAEQDGVAARLLVVDASAAGLPDASGSDGLTILRVEPWQPARALAALARTLPEPVVVLAAPAATLCQGALRRASTRLAGGADAVSADLLLGDGDGRPLERTSPAAMGEAPGPFWQVGFALRRELLATLRPAAGLPWALELLRRLRHEGRVEHESEPAALVPRSAWTAAFEDSVVDAGLVTLDRRGPPRAPAPRLSVLLEACSLDSARPALQALARQLLPPGTFEVLLLEGAAPVPCPTPPAYPFALRRVQAAAAPLGGRWNPALSIARGPLVLFLSERSLATPALVERHLHAHDGRQALVRGTCAAGPDVPAQALERWWQRNQAAAALAGADNLSAPLCAVLGAGGLRQELGPRALDELARRLESAGLEPHHDARALVVRRDPPPLRVLGQALPTAGQAAGRAEPFDSEARALDELGSIDLASLEGLGGAYAALAAHVEARLAERVPALLRRLGTEAAAPEASAVAERSRPARAARSARPDHAPELSVIVPTHDRPSALRNLLECLRRQDLEPQRFEVLVVDDASPRPAAEVLDARSYPFALRILRQEGGGPGRARNRALEHARGTWVVLLNDDAVPEPGALRRHLWRQQLREAPTAVLGRFDLLPEHRRDSLAAYVSSEPTLFAQPKMRAGVLYHGLALCSGNVSLPREALEAVGGFDAGFPYAGGEDSELGLRLERELGLRVLYDPAIGCGHDHAMDVRALLRRKRVVGWSLFGIQTRHGDLGLLPCPWPLVGASLAELERSVERGAASVEAIAAAVEERCARERARSTGGDARGLEELRATLPAAESLALLGGVLAAARGAPPLGGRSGAPRPAVAAR